MMRLQVRAGLLSGANEVLGAAARGANRDLQGDSGIAHDDAMFDARNIGDALLKFANVSTAIGKPTAIQNVAEAFCENVPIPDVRAAHMQEIFKRRISAQDRQRVSFSFCLSRSLVRLEYQPL